MRAPTWALVLLALPALSVRAAENELNLTQLIAEALERNPEIQAAQKRYEALRQRPSQERSLPDPMVSVGYNSNGNPLPFAGIGREPTANAGFMVSQEIPYPGKRRLRADVAVKEAQAEWQQYLAQELRVVSRLKQAYHRLHHTYSVAGILDRNLQVMDRLRRITEIRYSAGRAAQQDVLKAQTQVSILEGRRAQLERQRRIQELEINGLLNRPSGSPLGRPTDVPLPATLPKLDQLLEAARGRSPLLRLEEKKIERAESAVNLARKDFYPDYALTAGYFYMGVMPDMYMLRADVRIPLQLRRRRAAVTEKAYGLAESRRNYETAARDLQTRIADDHSMAETAARLMDIYSKTVIPQASLAMESSLVSYETGAVDFLTVLNNYSMLLEYEMNYHEEMENCWVALIRLEEMSGQLSEVLP